MILDEELLIKYIKSWIYKASWGRGVEVFQEPGWLDTELLQGEKQIRVKKKKKRQRKRKKEQKKNHQKIYQEIREKETHQLRISDSGIHISGDDTRRET